MNGLFTRALILIFPVSLLSFATLYAQKNCPKASGLQASDITETSALLSWSGSEQHTEYSVMVKHGPKSDPYDFKTTTNETSISIDDLKPGSAYRFKVKADCDKGSGGSSQWFAFETEGEPDSSTNGVGKCPPASNLAVLEITDTTALLSWLGNDVNVEYQVDVKQKEHTPSFRLSETVDTTVLFVEGLEAGGNYKFRVKASCEKNKAGSSSWINFTTTGGDSTFNQCPKPTNLSVLEVSDTSALLAWTSKDSVDHFRLDVKSYQGTTHFDLETTLEADSFLVDGLEPEGHYHFRVVAFCSDTSSSGSSDWSKFRTSATESDSSQIDGSLGEEEEEIASTITAEALKAFPNPATAELTVDIPMETKDNEIIMVMVDPYGRIVYRQNLKPGEEHRGLMSVQTGQLKEGVYKLVVKSIGFQKSQTVLIQH